MVYTFMFLMCVSLFCPFASGKSLEKHHRHKGDTDWDYLLFAQFWPPSSCIYLEEHHDSCEIPSDVKGWTIHGLWPSRPDSELPQNCNKSMPFDYSQIKSLRPRLDVNWHFYGTKENPTFLWSHEWNKHGTCAYSLPALRGEMKYFNQTLQLHSHINLANILASASIIPSKTKTYKREDFNNAVQNYTKMKPVIVCLYDKKTQAAYIDQIYLCFDKTFKLQDCYDPKSITSVYSVTDGLSYYDQCGENQPIHFPPYANKKVHHSNSPLMFHSEKSHH